MVVSGPFAHPGASSCCCWPVGTFTATLAPFLDEPPLRLSWAFFDFNEFIGPRIFDSNDIHRPNQGLKKTCKLVV